jgi:CDP-paratose 2-epimerase
MREGTERIALVTGGAGFIGSNLVQRLLLEKDIRVRVLDNFSRKGVQHNVAWLLSLEGQRRLEIIEADVRDAAVVREAARNATEIYHLAAQVAVTTSVGDPRADFSVNALGTFNVLEAARVSGRNPFFLYTSTNKVYGGLEDLAVQVAGTHYRVADPTFCGVTETQPLDFHSPYGCSKGAADQYVRDYARIYDLPSVVFRMSCIAGPRQFGNEDQGWVAHFLYSVLSGSSINIYGDGYQVRDVLHVHDLIDAMLLARDNRQRTRGEIYNLGGGMHRVVSVIEMLRRIERSTGLPLHLNYSATRPGDQPLYISDTARITSHTGWCPTRSLDQILDDIHTFWNQNRRTIRQHAAFAPHAPELIAEEVA